MIVENNKDLKYEYALYTWGGFYNSSYQVHHKYEPGVYTFDTAKERTDFIDKMKSLEKQHNYRHFAHRSFEGFDCTNLPCLHRIVEYKGKYYYSNHHWSWLEGISTLEYHMENKWYPGFNDEVVEETLVSEEIDYNKVKVIQEWITGSFTTYKQKET